MNRVPMTVSGVEMLREELQHRITTKRREIVDAIAEARAHGDLKENAEYHAAREQHSFNEGRILEIEAKLSTVQVIDVTQIENTGKVIFGVTVHLVNVDSEEAIIYQIVGEDEADIKQSKISVTSPIARGLISKGEGEEIDIQTPKGLVTFSILKVEHN